MRISPSLPVEHDVGRRRFHVTVENLQCVADYELADGVMRMTHTRVPAELQGRGIAGQLVAAALAHACREGLKVRPLCPYVQDYMRRHPETESLRA